LPNGQEGIQLERLPAPRHARAFFGTVEAPDEATAIKKAIEEFKIIDPVIQKRFPAQRTK
jgi:hypothetical protein